LHVHKRVEHVSTRLPVNDANRLHLPTFAPYKSVVGPYAIDEIGDRHTAEAVI